MEKFEWRPVRNLIFNRQETKLKLCGIDNIYNSAPVRSIIESHIKNIHNPIKLFLI